jgi:hypothetical protein
MIINPDKNSRYITEPNTYRILLMIYHISEHLLSNDRNTYLQSSAFVS